MSKSYDAQEEQLRLLREGAAAFCSKSANIARLRALRESNADFDRALWAEMAALGWSSLLIPEETGGLGAALSDMAVIAEELGKVVAPEPLIETAVLSAAVLAKAGDSRITRSLTEQIITGQGVPVLVRGDQMVQGEATRAGDDFVLNGSWSNVVLAAGADGFIVPLSLEGQLALFWIARDNEGVSIAPRILADGSRSGALQLENSRVAAEMLILQGVAAQAALDYATSAGYVIVSAYLLGLMERTLELTLDYMRSRRQFGCAIGSFQALQHRAVNLYIQQEITRAVVHEAADAFGVETDAEGCAVRAIRAKHRATEAALLITREAIQLHGAIGFTLECDVSLYLNRALVLAAQYGNVAGHRRLFAKRAPYAVAHDIAERETRPIVYPPDTDWNSMSDADFRMMVRQFFEKEYPEDRRFPSRKLRWSEIKDWYMTVSRKGWLAPNWPREYGGMGLEASKCIIFMEEQERWGVARTPADLGLTMVGPMLIQHGSEAQRRKYLPRILSGEHVWCQGYSEPNAGSDLASLRTTAVLDGEEFVINGQKTWTTMATDANYMFLLARTDKNAPKQAGISFLLLDFTSPGISVRPIKNLAGNEEFCEVFLDDVRVPAENLVGELNQGWTIAKSLLTFERLFLGSPKQSQYVLQRLAEFANERGLLEDPVFLDHFTRLRLDVYDLESAYARFAEVVRKGQPLGPDVSILKIWGTETCARLSELMVEAASADGATLGQLGSSGVDVLNQYYYSRAATIYGGSNEIQRNILAKQVLRLP